MSKTIPSTLNIVKEQVFDKGRYYFVLTTSGFGIYALWTGERWAYIDDEEEHSMAYGDTQIIYEAPQS